MEKVIGTKENQLNDIELGLEELSLQLISIFNRYRENGIINDDQYKEHIKVKENFLKYLKEKRNRSQELEK